MSTITLSGYYGYRQYRPDLADGTTIDANDATFIVDNNVADDGQALANPVSIRDAADITIIGGTILGKVDQTTDWRTIYQYDPGNSPAIYMRDAPGAHIDGWRIDKAWDAIRPSYNSENFLIENTWITNCRDDVVENDKLNSGTIRDCLFDGNFGGISLDPGSGSTYDGAGKTVVIDGVFMRMKSYLNEGRLGHTSPLKLDVNHEMPELRITNSVIAIEKVDHGGYERLAYAWANLVESSGNVYLNLSDTPLPGNYPLPPAGWTVLQGQAARTYWEQVRADWIANHDGDGGAEPPPPPPPPDGETSTFSGVSFVGTDKDETIVGNGLNNNIDGNGGNDKISGGAGNDVIRGDGGVDTISGGAGADTFFFKRTSDSNQKYGVDTILDFTKGDKIDLGTIDASASSTGNQAFKIVTTNLSKTPGELKVAYDAASNTTVVTGNVDSDLDAEFVMKLSGHVELVASDFIL